MHPLNKCNKITFKKIIEIIQMHSHSHTSKTKKKNINKKCTSSRGGGGTGEVGDTVPETIILPKGKQPSKTVTTEN